MLYGSADHLTGDSIASPVQLREEGRALPTTHLNYDPEDPNGRGKGKGKEPSRPQDGPRPKEGKEAEPPPDYTTPDAPPSSKAGPGFFKLRAEAKAGKAPPSSKAAPPASKAPSAAADGAVRDEVAVKQEVKSEGGIKEEVKEEVKTESIKEEADDGMSEIERRRKAKAAGAGGAPETPGVAEAVATPPPAPPAPPVPEPPKTPFQKMLAARAAAKAAAAPPSKAPAPAAAPATKAGAPSTKAPSTANLPAPKAPPAPASPTLEDNPFLPSDGMSEIEKRRKALGNKQPMAPAMPAHLEEIPEVPAMPEEEGAAVGEVKLEQAESESFHVVCPDEDLRRRFAEAEAAALRRRREAAEVEEQEAKRRRVQNEAECTGDDERRSIGQSATSAPPAAQGDTGAIKQGLQGWAERVNALGEEDPELVKRCREFVRKRILKAHATGDLHSCNWLEEPLPELEELQA